MIILVFSVLALNWQSLIIFSSLTHFKISHPKSIITPLILFPGAIESEQLLKIVYEFLIFSYLFSSFLRGSSYYNWNFTASRNTFWRVLISIRKSFVLIFDCFGNDLVQKM